MNVAVKLSAIICAIACLGCLSSDVNKNTLSDDASSCEESFFGSDAELNIIEEIEKSSSDKGKSGCVCRFLESLTSKKHN